jgi:hypothetical protein
MGNLLLNLGNSFLNQKGYVNLPTWDAVPGLLPDLVVTTALWLVAPAAMLTTARWPPGHDHDATIRHLRRGHPVRRGGG